MKFIEEVKKVGSKKYSRTLGATFTMQELLEGMEDCNYEIASEDESFYVGNPTEYTILIGTKEVDAKDISITLYDPEDQLSEDFYSKETGDYINSSSLERAEYLETLSKAELISELLEMENN